MSRSLFHKTNDNAYKLTKKNSKTDIGGPDSGEGRLPNSSEGLRDTAKQFPHTAEGLRDTAKRFPHTAEGLRDGARTFRTLRKRFATARGASELFGNASRHREMVPAHRGRAFLLNSLCPSGISPFKRGRKIEKQTIPAPPSEGGAPRRGEGVQNSGAAPLPMESFRKRGPKISRDTYIRE